MDAKTKEEILSCINKGDLATARLLVEIGSLGDDVLLRTASELINSLAADCEQLLTMSGQMHSLITDVAGRLDINADLSVAGMDQMLIEVQRVVHRAREWTAELQAREGV